MVSCSLNSVFLQFSTSFSRNLINGEDAMLRIFAISSSSLSIIGSIPLRITVPESLNGANSSFIGFHSYFILKRTFSNPFSLEAISLISLISSLIRRILKSNSC